MNRILWLLMMITVIVPALIISINIVYAQENATNSEDSRFFALRHANSGSISEINETTFILELNDISNKTILFSDKPELMITFVTTPDFIGNWTLGTEGSAVDRTSTFLLIDELEGKQNEVIRELFNPIYNSNKKTLTYYITPDNATSIDLPSKFGESTLVVDLGLASPISTD